MSESQPSWPQSPAEWRRALALGAGIGEDEGRRWLAEDRFPLPKVSHFIEEAYSPANGFHADFVPALLRNLRGLLDWTYGSGAEPHWPGADSDPRSSE